MARLSYNTDATLRAERVRLDRQGYTSGGRYFGVGMPLFHVEEVDADGWADGASDFERARDMKALKALFPKAKWYRKARKK